DAKLGAPANQHIPNPAHRVRAIRMAVWISPGIICWASNWYFAFEQFIVGLQVPIGHGPIGANAIFCVDTEIGRMKTRREGCPMYGAAANTLSAIVGAQRQRMGP